MSFGAGRFQFFSGRPSPAGVTIHSRVSLEIGISLDTRSTVMPEKTLDPRHAFMDILLAEGGLVEDDTGRHS